MVTNDFISDQFSLLAKLMEIHGENPFKAKSYSSASFTIDKLPVQLHSLTPDELFATKGIGESTGKKILEIIETGKLSVLEQLISATPSGILDMIQIKGIGPKKINTIWKEMQIESLGELLYACTENRLLLYKGFGAKTQQNVKEAIEFFLSHQDQFLFAETEQLTQTLCENLSALFPNETFIITGEYRRQMEIIRELEFVTTAHEDSLTQILTDQGFELTTSNDQQLLFKTTTLPVRFWLTTQANFSRVLFETSCSDAFLTEWKKEFTIDTIANEEDYFRSLNLHFIPACLREDPNIIHQAKKSIPTLIQPTDIKGIVHSHSTWSDGSNTLEEMVKACMDKGFEYLVISDHSKSAFYANGLTEERIIAQHEEIDALNAKYPSFKIFKSIECDILNDGSLDYIDDVLAKFDLVIASVHSNLKMTEEKAMNRLLNAIANPYTTILGHMTGRLLLSRPGYPVDHTQIIEACKKHQVAIELNAHPRRLDIDWRFIQQAIDAGVQISIDPDAHAIDGYDDVRYGVLAAQKGGATAANNLSSLSRAAFEQYIEERRSMIKR